MIEDFKAKEVKNQVVQWIRDWFEENGKGCNAVLGVSGGKDSSIVAALCVEALGKESHGEHGFIVLLPVELEALYQPVVRKLYIKESVLPAKNVLLRGGLA